MAVDLPAPSGPVRMLHGTRVVSAAISLAVFDARARVLVGSTDGRFHAALWSFGLVALTALRRVYRYFSSSNRRTAAICVYRYSCTTAALRASLYSCVSLHCALSLGAARSWQRIGFCGLMRTR